MNQKDLDYIDYLLTLTRDHKLEAEMIYSALQEMKNDPSLGIVEAIQLGYDEWIK